MVTIKLGDTPDDKREAWLAAVNERSALERAMVAAVQGALNDEDRVGPFLSLYRPSPGQLPDHVHHRVAVIAARAICEMFERQVKEDRDGAS